jgi:hypothetical protein
MMRSASLAVRVGTSLSNEFVCGAGRVWDHPTSFAEFVATSAFLDFERLPNGRWFHDLYASSRSHSGGRSCDRG